MSYGSLSARQAQVVRRFVTGRVVHDLGAGNLQLARQLVQLGARRVIAVDCNRRPDKLPRDIEYVEASFAQFAKLEAPLDVAFVSWPTQYSTRGLVALLRRARRVIYVGVNEGGTVCGSSSFFKEVSQREQLRFLPCPNNDLLVYGDRRVARELNEHEKRALAWADWLDDDEGEAAELGVLLRDLLST